MCQNIAIIRRALRALTLFLALAPTAVSEGVAIAMQFSGAIYTTDSTGARVNQNIYSARSDVYLSGGPQNQNPPGLPDGTYYFQVTDPSGHTLLSTDNAVCRQLLVAGGRVAGATGPCPHANGTFNPANGATPVQLAPFAQTPSSGGEYKAWLIRQTGATSISTGDPKVILFKQPDAKTDNFKVREGVVVPPQGSCLPSSSLSVLVSGTNVISYVPKGCWLCGTTGISFVNVEGTFANGLPNPIPTPHVVNSCASNSLTGKTVCTANNTDIYVLTLSGTGTTTLAPAIPSGGSGTIGFSGGSCTNCGVAMDATNDQAVIGLSVAGAPGFQFLKNVSTAPATEAPFTSPAGQISEDPLLDPIRNLLLSAAENNKYEIAKVATTTSPAFFENGPIAVSGELDSSGEDCETGIVLSPAEFSGPSQVYIADISNPTCAVFTPGAPGTWTAPSQIKTLTGSLLSAGASGIAVAQGTHTGVVAGEFGGDALTAIALPATSGSCAVPDIPDWVTCSITAAVASCAGFSNGLDPHTVTAYRSPNAPNHAFALLANNGATMLARVDLTEMLNPVTVPRTGNVCTSGSLPASVVTCIPVP